MHPFLAAPLPLAVAHRGGDTPAGCENTLAAFAHAVALGYRCLETDLRASADGVLVCMHDPTVERLSASSGALAELTWSQLQRVRIAGRERIASFDELLGAFPSVRLIVDAKEDAVVDPLIAAVRRHGAWERVCIGSFSRQRLRRVRAAAPRLCTSMAPAEVALLRAASLRLLPLRAVPRAPSVAQVPINDPYSGRRLVDRRFVVAAHRLGVPVQVWTVNDPATAGELLDVGVDGIITDAVGPLRTLLVGRGA